MTEKPTPWPQTGRFEFRWRRAVWALARPWYGAKNVRYALSDLARIWPISFWFPFVTYRGPWVHWYIGWKPISLDDPAFYWRELATISALHKAGAQFVQASARWGVGEVS